MLPYNVPKIDSAVGATLCGRPFFSGGRVAPFYRAGMGVSRGPTYTSLSRLKLLRVGPDKSSPMTVSDPVPCDARRYCASVASMSPTGIASG